MRSVKKTFVKRLKAQANEASVQGFDKLASYLEKISDNLSTRPDKESYTYSENDLVIDVEKSIWNGVIRAADYYDCFIDAYEMQNLVEKFSSEFIKEFRVKNGIKHGIGAYESAVPGEVLSKITLEVDDEE